MAVQNFGSGGGGYQVSPGVNISEIDLTTVVPSTSTTVGAIGGVFRWGPVGVRTLVTSENDLVRRFGKPASTNPETFFAAASFLAYSNALYVSRAANTSTVFAAVANTAGGSGVANSTNTVKNRDDYDTKTFGSGVEYVAKYPGALGNSLKISVCDSPEAYSQTFDLTADPAGNGSNTSFENSSLSLSVGSNTATILIANTDGVGVTNSQAQSFATGISALFATGDYIQVGNSSIGKQSLKITSISVANAETANIAGGRAAITVSLDQPLKLSTAISTTTTTRFWEYASQVDAAPGTSFFQSQTPTGNTAAIDEVHVVVVDEDGGFTGAPGAILEVFKGLSRATDAKNADGSTNYYKTIINDQSQYVWFAADRSGAASATAATLVSSTNEAPNTLSFAGGVDNDEATVAFADVARAYDLFAATEEVDISLVLTGASRGGTVGEQTANYLIDNIAEVRKDCVVFVSPQKADVLNNIDAATDVVAFRNAVRSSTFGVLDSGYKYMYDKYNDVYRWVPLNGDTAGTCVITDNSRDPWFSPAGYTRGQLRNVIKLAFNPNKAERDLLYKNGVNPVINEPGVGPILFGDKTLSAKPSAFDRINVRRLFIVLEKTISKAAKSFLFEFNDEFTRAQFKTLVEPFLREVQSRRGIYDYKVVCDETNNTAEVIDSNRFVGDIYIKPARAINYIQLNFVAVRSGIEFSEIVG